MEVQGLEAVRTRCQMINEAQQEWRGTSIQELGFVVFWRTGYRMNDVLAIALHSTSKLMLQPAPLLVRSSMRKRDP
jgi:hypothetical protein